MTKKASIILLYAISVILVIFAYWKDTTSCNLYGIVAELFLIIAGLFGVIKLCYPTLLKSEKAQKILRVAVLLLLFILSISGLTIYYHRRLSHLVDADGNPNVGNMLMVAIPVILFLIIGILQLKIRNMQRLVQLHNALDKIELLKRSLAEASVPAQPEVETNADQLRVRLRDELDNLPDTASDVSFKILSSDIYVRLQEMLHNDAVLTDDSKIWGQLEAAVTESSPHFTARLRLLSCGRITPSELQIALLIKCGFTTAQMAKLLCRSRGAIISRRETLCVRLFGEKIGSKNIEKVIRII